MTNPHIPPINNNNNNRSSSNATTQACAACKYRRRKCTPDCILAPYFPHHRHRQFLNAHKLFGVSNITKIISPLQYPLNHHAMRTIIFQSDVRAADPVGGCYRIVLDLQRQIDLCRAELDLVLHQLAFWRAQANNNNNKDDSSSTIDNNNCDLLKVDDSNLCSYEQMVNYGDQNQQQYMLQKHDDIDDRLVVVPLQDEINSWAMRDSVQPCASSIVSGSPVADDHITAGGGSDDGERHEYKFQLFDDTNQPRFEELSLSLV